MENKTAVERLKEQLIKLIPPGNELSIFLMFNKAEEMEKQQIIDFAEKYNDYCFNSYSNNRYIQIKSAKQYYDETYYSLK